MAKDPAFLFYSSDFLTGTMAMTFEDRGKYITVLSYMHQNGRVDEETIRLLVGNVSDKLKSKFIITENGLWYNERLESEVSKRNAYVASRVENGSKGGRPKINHKDNHMVRHKANHSEDVDVIEDKDIIIIEKFPFENFWNIYDKKTGRVKCEAKWLKLSEQDKGVVMARLPGYIAATPNPQYRKDPYTWLNGSHWLDEYAAQVKQDPFELLSDKK
jgi:uncharacterized protein YdaU (DUF1376 family)